MERFLWRSRRLLNEHICGPHLRTLAPSPECTNIQPDHCVSSSGGQSLGFLPLSSLRAYPCILQSPFSGRRTGKPCFLGSVRPPGFFVEESLAVCGNPAALELWSMNTCGGSVVRAEQQWLGEED